MEKAPWTIGIQNKVKRSRHFPATANQRWFIRALARDSGKEPKEWLIAAKQHGAFKEMVHGKPETSTHQGFLHAQESIDYEDMSAAMAGRLIAWMRLSQLQPTYSPGDPKPR